MKIAITAIGYAGYISSKFLFVRKIVCFSQKNYTRKFFTINRKGGAFMVCDKVDENISCYYGIYAEIVKVIGADKMKAFYEIVKGQQIVFPMKLYSKEYIVSIAQSGERNINELAKEFGYSERYFRRMIAENAGNKESNER